MTTVAMVAGMLPVAIGWGGDSDFRGPMAIAVIGGLITSTVLTLVIVPAVFTVLDDIERWIAPKASKLLAERRRPRRRRPTDRFERHCWPFASLTAAVFAGREASTLPSLVNSRSAQPRLHAPAGDAMPAAANEFDAADRPLQRPRPPAPRCTNALAAEGYVAVGIRRAAFLGRDERCANQPGAHGQLLPHIDQSRNCATSVRSAAAARYG